MRIVKFISVFLLIGFLGFGQNDEWGVPSDFKPKDEKKYWYASNLEAGYGLGLKEHGKDFIRLSWFHGLYLNDNCATGIGAGFKQILQTDTAFFPLFANFRVKFDNEINYPFFNVNIGYSLNISDNFSPVGFFWTPTLGYRFDPNKRVSGYVSMGWELQQIDTIVSDPRVQSGRPIETTVTSSAFYIAFGLSF